MANEIALIAITAMAVLGVYYTAELVGTALLPKAARPTVVLPYLESRGDMTGAVLCARAGWPGCRVVVLCQTQAEKGRLPLAGYEKAVTREELAGLFPLRQP